MLHSVSPEEAYLTELSGYWKKRLQGASAVILPFNQYNLALKEEDLKTNNITFFIDPSLAIRVLQLSQQQNTTPFTIMVVALKALLYRYTSQNNILICTAEGQTNSGLINKLILNDYIEGDDSFIKLIKKVTTTILEAQNNPLAIETISGYYSPEKDEFAALHQILFINNIHQSSSPSNISETILINSTEDYSPHFDLVFTLTVTDEGLTINVDFNSEKFLERNIVPFTEHFKNILLSAIDAPEKAIGALNILSDKERDELLFRFNDTNIEYPKNKTLAALFEDQVLKTPDSIALRQQEQTLTYRQLNERANRLAYYLMERGVKPKDNVGLLVKRGFDMIVGMYAILKAGGAYVPIDPEYPEDRQQYILLNSGVSLSITDGNYEIQKLIPSITFVSIHTVDISEYICDNPCLAISSHELAYTIYTSGSTGRPKGVMIEHHSAVNLVLWVNKRFNIGENDRLLFITSMCFDLSVYDIFGMLCSGGSIVIAEQQEVTDLRRLQKMLQDYQITFWDSVPTTLDYLVRDLEMNGDSSYINNSLRLVFLSGDWIPVNLPTRIKKHFPSSQVISLGGATEGTVWSNYYPIETIDSTWKSIPYGKPMYNNYFYILNEYLQPVPIGVAGELYIGGVGVARGYANDPEKTANSFKPDPFTNKGGGMMYKTGDLGRMLPDYNMEFIGRKDNQVKIRGFRIELGEIESVIRQTGMVTDIITIAKDDKEGKKRLISYVVANGSFSKEEMSVYLKSKLPEYMIPSIWIRLDRLPLTSNGKIDKKALPDFDAEEQLKSQYEAPKDDLEQELADIWQSVLGSAKIGVNDNFFDLGGHSLIAVQIMTGIENKTGIKLPISVLFRYPTIRTLHHFIHKENVQTKFKCLAPIKPEGSKPPLYLIHGDGLNILIFSALASLLDKDQPVYGIQAQGLDGVEAPPEVMEEIAADYLKEVLAQNPNGPYTLAGYSFGGYIAIEMRRQLVQMGKKVKLLAVFDTNAENTEYVKPLANTLFVKLKRQFPKFLFIFQSFTKHPILTTKYQGSLFSKKLKEFSYSAGIIKEPETTEYYINLNRIARNHDIAIKNYKLEPFDASLHLFKATERVYFVDDRKYLGWSRYAKKGVFVHEVPGDHKTMFEQPNVSALAQSLQQVLDNNQ